VILPKQSSGNAILLMVCYFVLGRILENIAYMLTKGKPHRVQRQISENIYKNGFILSALLIAAMFNENGLGATRGEDVGLAALNLGGVAGLIAVLLNVVDAENIVDLGRRLGNAALTTVTATATGAAVAGMDLFYQKLTGTADAHDTALALTPAPDTEIDAQTEPDFIKVGFMAMVGSMVWLLGGLVQAGVARRLDGFSSVPHFRKVFAGFDRERVRDAGDGDAARLLLGGDDEDG